ncbi:hypothetical protein KY289_031592 [Solanum tuberosum]|nr:hypothetical protein KY289_031592 [Solanum tuberosum]
MINFDRKYLKLVGDWLSKSRLSFKLIGISPELMLVGFSDCALFWLWVCCFAGARDLAEYLQKQKKVENGRGEGKRTGRLLFLLRLIGDLKLLTESASCGEQGEKGDGVLRLGLVT